MSDERAEKDLEEAPAPVREASDGDAGGAGAATEPEAAAEPESQSETAAEPEPEPEPEPEIRRIRQWVTLRNASMDVRAGVGLSSTVAHDLRSAIGRPHACALLHEPGAPEALVEELRRGLLDQGFDVHVVEMPGAGCTLARVAAVGECLAACGITGDDLVVALGGMEGLSVANFACASWCGGTSLAEVPLDMVSAVAAGTTPRALDLPAAERMVTQEGAARFSIVDASVLGFDPGAEDTLHAFALMVATAMDDSDKAFGRLWDNAGALVAGDMGTVVAQLADTVKSRGRVVSSTALSTRQSIAYGTTFARALGSVAGPAVPESALLADGLRFAARLAVAKELFSIDDMFAQDELLEKLGVGTCEVPVDPDALVAAIRAERYARTRRFMLAVPRAIGRVRLSTVEDDLLAEHVGAWCATRPGA